MRVLVTGGAGYIGSHTVHALRRRGHYVWVYDNLSQGHSEAVAGAPLIIADLDNTKDLHKFCAESNLDAVIHFAGSAYVGESVNDPATYYRNNVTNSLALLEIMRQTHISRFVFSSSCATYGLSSSLPLTEETEQRPITPYGRSKLIVEQALADYNAAYSIGYAALRYFNAAGASADGTIGEDHRPETHLVAAAMRAVLGVDGPITIYGVDYDTPDGTCVRDYIHVDDLADAHIAALEQLQPKQKIVCNLGTERGYSVKDILDGIKRVTGSRVPYSVGPRRSGDPAALVARCTRVRELLGWQPRYRDINVILESAWRWHCQHPQGYAA
jgi:UDP-glucose-4-epimerase GalE